MNRVMKIVLACATVALVAGCLALPVAAFADSTSNAKAENALAGALSAQELETTTPDAGEDTTADQSASDAAIKASPKVSISVCSDRKWTKKWAVQGKSAGKSGKGVNAIKFKVERDGLAGSVKYRVYAKDAGWQKWKSNGAASGKPALSVLGIQARLTGKLGKEFAIVMRVHTVDGAWQPWATNKAIVGSTGKLGQIDRVQAKLVRKQKTVSPASTTYFITSANEPTTALTLPGASASTGKQLVCETFDATSQEERFFLREEADGAYAIQSASSGKFLYDADGKAVQRPYSDKPAMRWQITWDSGYVITNAATGKNLALSGKKVVVADEAFKWMLSSATPVSNGYLTLTSAASGKVLAVKKESDKDGAALVVKDEDEIASEAFMFKPAGKDAYQLVNVFSGKALAVKGASKENDAAVVQLPLKDTDAQKWTVTLDDTGAFILTNKASNNVLTASSSGKTGSAVKSSANVDDDTQRWTIKKSTYSLTGDYKLDAEIAKIVKARKTLRSCFSYVVGFGYRSGSKYGKTYLSDKTSSAMAKEMISRHSGNCYRFAALFSWLARGLGYSSKVRTGYVPSASGGWAPHGWTEIYINGHTYICDPDLAHEIPGHNWYMTTYGGAPVSYSR